MGLFVKRFLPRTLFGRSLLIIVTPLILLQVVAAWIFYDRHWETITRRLAVGVSGEIALVIEHRRKYPQPENERWVFAAAGSNFQMRMTFQKGSILPNAPPLVGSGILDRLLFNALVERVRRPFHMDTGSRGRDVFIRVQLTDGVLDVLVPRERLFSSTTYIFVMWMVGTSMVLFAVATVFMRNQVRPIRRLAAAVDSFGKGREVPDFKPEGAAEVRSAAAAFEVMRERVQRAIGQRTEMLAGVSHDLRTPLTRMKLQLAMLADSKAIQELKYDVSEMEKMVEGYLGFARGENAEPVASTDLKALLDEVVTGARREGAAIDLDSESGITVDLRPNAFKRCVNNLVTNAMLHADHVAIRARRAADAIEITIDDDGPGIPEEEREAVFKPFYRLDGSRNPETGGTGLGLTIARDIMHGHGGDIILNDAPGGGLRALLKLPL